MSAAARSAPTSGSPFKVLVVDDEPALHDVTRLVLRRVRIDGHRLEFLDAYSAAEARSILERERDVAVAMVDVVMEDDQAGLNLVRDMRDVFGMNLTRIILRTGHPGLAPEREVIEHFEIDDYRAKTELTADRLFTAVYTALRSYRTLRALDLTAAGLEQLLHVRPPYRRRSEIGTFAADLLDELAELLAAAGAEQSASELAVFSVRPEDEQPYVVTARAKRSDGGVLQSPEDLGEDSAFRVVASLREPIVDVTDRDMVATLPKWNDQPIVLWVRSEGSLESHVARILRLFVERLNTLEERERLEHEIAQAQNFALNKLVEAVDMRSKETGEHISRMAHYARLLGSLSGMNDEDLDLLEAAAPLHDVGKVAIPDAILLKPGRLTDEEMEVMRTHAAIGAQLLTGTDSRMLQLAETIALTHHEKWDGSGYPSGLSGEDIPLAGRIVALADVFDAVLSNRVYKNAMSFEEALAIIEEGAGRHFDPTLAQTFLESAADFHAIFRASTAGD